MNKNISKWLSFSWPSLLPAVGAYLLQSAYKNCCTGKVYTIGVTHTSQPGSHMMDEKEMLHSIKKQSLVVSGPQSFSWRNFYSPAALCWPSSAHEKVKSSMVVGRSMKCLENAKAFQKFWKSSYGDLIIAEVITCILLISAFPHL